MKTRSGGSPIRVAALALAVCMNANQIWADSDKQYFNIQTDQVGEALKAFAVQTDNEILFAAAVVKNRKTPGLNGEYTEEEALRRILEGTGLKANKTKDNVFLIQASAEESSNKKKLSSPSITNNHTENTRKNSDVSKPSHIEEITVTANKREQSLRDVAMSITALSVEDIGRKSLVSMQDYLNTIPGVNMLDRGVGANNVIMRGIGISLSEQSTVNTYLGEVPLTNILRFSASTDMKLVDMQRIEVLRGPQGTLYGSSAMGGTIRNIPVSPNLKEVEGSLNIGYGITARSDNDNDKVVGILNLPLVEDELALRVAAYQFDNAGYKDLVTNPALETLAENTGTAVDLSEDVGGHTYTGSRATLLWQPYGELKLSMMLAQQELEEDGRVDVKVSNGNYTLSALDTGNEFKEEDFEFVNMILEYDLEWGTLVASSTLSEGTVEDQQDLSKSGFAAIQFRSNEKKGKVHEIRLSSNLTGPLQFITGFYYEDSEIKSFSPGEWVGSISSMPAFFGTDPTFFIQNVKQTAEQTAIFGDLTYSINQNWKVSLGSRWFDYDRQDKESSTFAGVSGTPINVVTEEKSTNFKINVDYTPNDDALLYAQWAQGFRLGFGQTVPTAALCDTDQDGNLDFTNAPLDPGPVDSDSTNNYELGGKFSFLENRLTLNAALYRIDWKDIPITVRSSSPTCFDVVRVNGGEARSQGAELEASFYLTPNLQLSLSASYINAEFLDDGIGEKGDRLPLSPKFNGNVGVQYDFSIVDQDAFLRADYNYVGGYFTDIPRNFPESGDYGKLSMRAGVKINRFTAEIYGTNLTNEDTLTVVAGENFGFRLQPRILGVDIGYQF